MWDICHLALTHTHRVDVLFLLGAKECVLCTQYGCFMLQSAKSTGFWACEWQHWLRASIFIRTPLASFSVKGSRLNEMDLLAALLCTCIACKTSRRLQHVVADGGTFYGNFDVIVAGLSKSWINRSTLSNARMIELQLAWRKGQLEVFIQCHSSIKSILYRRLVLFHSTVIRINLTFTWHKINWFSSLC